MRHFWNMIAILLYCLILWAVVIFVSCCAGCANRGQYYREYYPDGRLKIHSEFYDWKFLYWFGTEAAGSETPYWKLYAKKITEYPDPNAVEAVVEGAVKGAVSETCPMLRDT